MVLFGPCLFSASPCIYLEPWPTYLPCLFSQPISSPPALLVLSTVPCYLVRSVIVSVLFSVLSLSDHCVQFACLYCPFLYSEFPVFTSLQLSLNILHFKPLCLSLLSLGSPAQTEWSKPFMDPVETNLGTCLAQGGPGSQTPRLMAQPSLHCVLCLLSQQAWLSRHLQPSRFLLQALCLLASSILAFSLFPLSAHLLLSPSLIQLVLSPALSSLWTIVFLFSLPDSWITLTCVPVLPVNLSLL